MSDNLVIEGNEYALHRSTYVVGRGEECDLLLPELDASASRRHALLERAENGQWYVSDLGSKNGTYLDGVAVQGRTMVPDGAAIKIGATSMTIAYGLAARKVQIRQPEPEPEPLTKKEAAPIPVVEPRNAPTPEPVVHSAIGDADSIPFVEVEKAPSPAAPAFVAPKQEDPRPSDPAMPAAPKEADAIPHIQAPQAPCPVVPAFVAPQQDGAASFAEPSSPDVNEVADVPKADPPWPPLPPATGASASRAVDGPSIALAVAIGLSLIMPWLEVDLFLAQASGTYAKMLQLVLEVVAREPKVLETYPSSVLILLPAATTALIVIAALMSKPTKGGLLLCAGILGLLQVGYVLYQLTSSRYGDLTSTLGAGFYLFALASLASCLVGSARMRAK
jgi:hypothetical protein